MNMFDLKNKNILITGGTHGIGETTALLFNNQGASVWIIGRNELNFKKIETEKGGKGIKFIKCDLSNRKDVMNLAEWIDKTDVIFDVLINNASRNSRYNILNIPQEEWDSMIELNLTSVMMLTQHVAKRMVDSGKKGKIINIGAIQSFYPLDSSLAYSTVKGGLRSFTKSLAVDLGPYGILVTLVMPGPIYAKGDSYDVPEDLDKRAATLIGRMGRTIEVAKLLSFLASDENTFMTGNEIIIDGGRSISRKPDPSEIQENII
ncbi:MAG: SDR family NAD(P)-dependent oxidoreductase [Thermoplasmata archaeon]